MQEDQLKLLEARINNAIVFIETLKSREKRLIQEKEELDIKISSFEKVIAEKDSKIEELKGSQGFLREKIEAILGKLESFATIDTDGQFDLKVFPENEKSETIVPDEGEADVIIEDEVVDLKKENVKVDHTVEENEEELSGDEGSSTDMPDSEETGITIELEPQEEGAGNGDLAQPGKENSPDEMSGDNEDVLDGIISEDIFQEEKPVQVENVIQSVTSVEVSEAGENTAENAEEMPESSKEESLAMEPALENNENPLFTAENHKKSESLFQNDNTNEINKIRDNTGGSFNKGWIDNNPFIQT